MNRSILIRIATDPPERMASTVNPIIIPTDDIETDEGALYIGGGEILGGLDNLEQLINGIADRIDLQFSGVSAYTAKLAVEEAATIKGKDVDIGVVRFDGQFQIIGVEWRAKYRADKLSTARSQNVRTITLSMGSDDTGRSMAKNAYWTDADQRQKSPTDRFFDHIAGINQGTSRTFGTSD